MSVDCKFLIKLVWRISSPTQTHQTHPEHNGPISQLYEVLHHTNPIFSETSWHPLNSEPYHLPIIHTDPPNPPDLTISSLYDILHCTNHVFYKTSRRPISTDTMTTHPLSYMSPSESGPVAQRLLSLDLEILTSVPNKALPHESKSCDVHTDEHIPLNGLFTVCRFDQDTLLDSTLTSLRRKCLQFFCSFLTQSNKYMIYI